MTAPPLEAQAAVLAAYQQQTSQIRERLSAYTVALWASLGEYRQRQMGEFIAQAGPVVEGAIGQMQASTSAYIATLTGLSGGSATPVATGSLTVSKLRNGAGVADVYGRPFHLVWRRLSATQPLTGEKVAAAIQAGQDRAVQTAVTDLQLAKTHTARGALREARNITGYRRQIEGPHTCALCIVAATRSYHKADLMPIHPGCDCSVVPLFGHWPGAVVDANMLATVHDVVAQQFGADSAAARKIAGAFNDDGSPVLYRDVLITHDHGELGPVLAVRGADHAPFSGTAA